MKKATSTYREVAFFQDQTLARSRSRSRQTASLLRIEEGKAAEILGSPGEILFEGPLGLENRMIVGAGRSSVEGSHQSLADP